MPMLGQMEATFSIIVSSTRIEAVFFSVAMTTPLVANGRVPNYRMSLFVVWRRPVRYEEALRGPHTFDTKARGTGRNSGKGVFDLDKLSRWREGGEGETV